MAPTELEENNPSRGVFFSMKACSLDVWPEKAWLVVQDKVTVVDYA